MPADSYALGVDLGTTFSAAAVARAGVIGPVSLGTVAQAIPSIVAVRPDGRVLVGEAAEMSSLSDPDRSARQFKRRIGDDVPLVLGGVPYGAETLTGYLLRAIVEQVAEREGARPAQLVLTHPANWSPFKLAVLEEAANVAGVSGAQLLAEPLAAAIAYESRERVAVDELLAVYDLGGGTFDVALVRRTPDSYDLVGRPAGLDRLGGIDFDQAVFAHVDAALDGAATAAAADPNAHRALSRLRADCCAAKQHLSSSPDVSIPVMLPDTQTEVRLTRDEFESMVRPRIAQTIEVLDRTVTEAGLTFGDVARVLLVGGSSLIPLVADSIRELTGRPVAVDAHPKLTIATGAALWADTRARADPSPDPTGAAATAGPGRADDDRSSDGPPVVVTTVPVGPVDSPEAHERRRRSRRRRHRQEAEAAARAAAAAVLADAGAKPASEVDAPEAGPPPAPPSPTHATLDGPGAGRPASPPPASVPPPGPHDPPVRATTTTGADDDDGDILDPAPDNILDPELDADPALAPGRDPHRRRVAVYVVAAAILVAFVVGVVVATTGGDTAHTTTVAASKRKHGDPTSTDSTTTASAEADSTTSSLAATSPASTSPGRPLQGVPARVTATTAKAGPPPCQSSQLTGNVGSPDGTAGHLNYALTLMNASSVTCTLSGYPGVALFDANGAQIGPAATKEPGHPITVVTLAPTQIAYTRLTAGELGNGACPGPSATIHMYPPGQVAFLSFAGVVQTCAAGLTVTPMAPGSGA